MTTEFNGMKLLDCLSEHIVLDDEDYVNGQLSIIKDMCDAGDVLKATVTITRILDDGTVDHMELNVDNEADRRDGLSVVLQSDMETASMAYRSITDATATSLSESKIAIAGEELVAYRPK